MTTDVSSNDGSLIIYSDARPRGRASSAEGFFTTVPNELVNFILKLFAILLHFRSSFIYYSIFSFLYFSWSPRIAVVRGVTDISIQPRVNQALHPFHFGPHSSLVNPDKPRDTACVRRAPVSTHPNLPMSISHRLCRLVLVAPRFRIPLVRS
ncbi:unnamed protein product [Nippostrongylus brasiliensis]|uniref:Uncharacterized protein n=1 Tax=Nippostrongylus brasiliensis TaxID=27835 RepID=A0A0N4YYR4_NIPBR|nr:unnamed protein product [Nippostrongylus brasiliensis]